MRRGATRKLAMFGSSLVSAYWNGAATYYRGILRELHALGFEISFFEPDAYERQAHRDMADPSWARVVVYEPTEAGVARCLEAAKTADFVVKASGIGVLDELLEREVPGLASPSRGVLFWDVDAPATLERIARSPADPFRPQVPRYHLVLTYGGGARVVEAYRRLGAHDCVPVCNALDPATHFPVPKEARFAGDLAFLGNRLPDREARVEEFFLGPARRLPHLEFVLGGNGWEEGIAVSANVRRIGHVYTHEHNAFNCSARAVININRSSMARTGYSPPTRVFEAAGAGACLLCDSWEGLPEFLEPDREVLVVGSSDEVCGTLQQLSPQQCHRIGEAARRRVLAEHTYAHRARTLLAALEGCPPMSRAIPSAAQRSADVRKV